MLLHKVLGKCCSSMSTLCRGLDAVRQSERVYLEAYTSLLLVPKEKLVCECWLLLHCLKTQQRQGKLFIGDANCFQRSAGNVLWQRGYCSRSRDGGDGERRGGPGRLHWRPVAIGRLFARLLLQARLCLLVVNLQEADTILEGAQEKNVSFLVVGDPFG